MSQSVERAARSRDDGGSSTFILRSGEPEAEAVSIFFGGNDNSSVFVSMVRLPFWSVGLRSGLGVDALLDLWLSQRSMSISVSWFLGFCWWAFEE